MVKEHYGLFENRKLISCRKHVCQLCIRELFSENKKQYSANKRKHHYDVSKNREHNNKSLQQNRWGTFFLWQGIRGCTTINSRHKHSSYHLTKQHGKVNNIEHSLPFSFFFINFSWQPTEKGKGTVIKLNLNPWANRGNPILEIILRIWILLYMLYIDLTNPVNWLRLFIKHIVCDIVNA